MLLREVGMVILYGMALGYCYGSGISRGHQWWSCMARYSCLYGWLVGWLVGTVAQCLVMVGVYQGGINGGHVKSLPPDGRLHPEWAEDGRSSSSSSSMLLVIESGLVNIINNNRTSLDLSSTELL